MICGFTRVTRRTIFWLRAMTSWRLRLLSGILIWGFAAFLCHTIVNWTSWTGFWTVGETEQAHCLGPDWIYCVFVVFVVVFFPPALLLFPQHFPSTPALHQPRQPCPVPCVFPIGLLPTPELLRPSLHLHLITSSVYCVFRFRFSVQSLCAQFAWFCSLVLLFPIKSSTIICLSVCLQSLLYILYIFHNIL